jgi:hypothetical protein
VRWSVQPGSRRRLAPVKHRPEGRRASGLAVSDRRDTEIAVIGVRAAKVDRPNMGDRHGERLRAPAAVRKGRSRREKHRVAVRDRRLVKRRRAEGSSEEVSSAAGFLAAEGDAARRRRTCAATAGPSGRLLAVSSDRRDRPSLRRSSRRR